MKKQYERYLVYLRKWVETHTVEDEPNSPACYDEFCENEDFPEFSFDKNGEFTVQEILSEIGSDLKQYGFGWVAMDECGVWFLYEDKPHLDFANYWVYDSGEFSSLGDFVCLGCKIKPATDWTKSLIKL